LVSVNKSLSAIWTHWNISKLVIWFISTMVHPTGMKACRLLISTHAHHRCSFFRGRPADDNIAVHAVRDGNDHLSKTNDGQNRVKSCHVSLKYKNVLEMDNTILREINRNAKI